MKKIAQLKRRWDGRSLGSKSDKVEFFLSFSKRPELVWDPYCLLGIMYCNSLETNWLGREPNNSPVSSAQVMMFSTKVSLVLRFQLNEQQMVKVVRVSGTDSTVKCGLVAVQIGTALLVKVSVFRYLV
jgi:hypothetical protein